MKFFIIILIASLFSCENNSLREGPIWKSKNFIHSYLTDIRNIDSRLSEKDSLSILTWLEGKVIIPNPQTPELFDSLARKFNDTTFNRSVLLIPTESVLSDTIESIHMITNQDFNRVYKKGDLIDNVIDIEYAIYNEVLLSSYQDLNAKHSISLTNFNQLKNKVLLERIFTMKFKEKPSSKGIFSFTIEITQTDKTILQHSFALDFN